MPIFIVINVIIISVIVNITACYLFSIIIVSLASEADINIMRDGKLGSKINKRPRRFGGSRSMTNTKIVVLLEKIRKFFRIYKSGANETLQRQKDKSFIIIISLLFRELIFQRMYNIAVKIITIELKKYSDNIEGM